MAGEDRGDQECSTRAMENTIPALMSIREKTGVQ